MKKIVLTVAMFIVLTNAKAQITIDSKGVEVFHIDSLFEDVSTSLLSSKIVETPGVNQAELKRRLLNYAGIVFRNVSKVLVSESDDQLVFNTFCNVNFKVMGGYAVLEEHIRVVVQIKDERFRVLIYDDGNAFIPGAYSKDFSSPPVAAHTVYFSSRFKDKTAKNKGMYKSQFEMIQNLDIEVNYILNSFENAGLISSSNENISGLNSNW